MVSYIAASVLIDAICISDVVQVRPIKAVSIIYILINVNIFICKKYLVLIALMGLTDECISWSRPN